MTFSPARQYALLYIRNFAQPRGGDVELSDAEMERLEMQEFDRELERERQRKWREAAVGTIRRLDHEWGGAP
jgi:hypothetical protein